MKIVKTILFVSIFVVSGFSKTPTKSQIDTYIKKGYICENLQDIKGVVVDKQEQITEKGIKISNKVWSCSNIKKIYYKQLIKDFTDKDVELLIKFYNSPLGKKWAISSSDSYEMTSKISETKEDPKRLELVKNLITSLNMDKTIEIMLNLLTNFEEKYSITKTAPTNKDDLKNFIYPMLMNFLPSSLYHEMRNFTDEEIIETQKFYQDNISAKKELILSRDILEEIDKQMTDNKITK